LELFHLLLVILVLGLGQFALNVLVDGLEFSQRPFDINLSEFVFVLSEDHPGEFSQEVHQNEGGETANTYQTGGTETTQLG